MENRCVNFIFLSSKMTPYKVPPSNHGGLQWRGWINIRYREDLTKTTATTGSDWQLTHFTAKCTLKRRLLSSNTVEMSNVDTHTKTIIRSDSIQKHRDLTAMENLITTPLRLATMTFRSAFFNTAFQHAVMQFSKKINDSPSRDAVAA